MDSYRTYSDEQLLALLKDDDELAFDAIYHRYWKSLYSLSCFRLKDFQLAEEIVHDVFVDLWSRRKIVEVKESFSAYIAVATKYRIVNAKIKRRKLHFREQSTTQPDDNSISNLPEQQHEFNDLLSKLLSTLPEKSQLIFQLSKQKGFCHQEIASHLNISEKTVEYHLSKAVKALRVGLGNLFFIEAILGLLKYFF